MQHLVYSAWCGVVQDGLEDNKKEVSPACGCSLTLVGFCLLGLGTTSHHDHDTRITHERRSNSAGGKIGTGKC